MKQPLLKPQPCAHHAADAIPTAAAATEDGFSIGTGGGCRSPAACNCPAVGFSNPATEGFSNTTGFSKPDTEGFSTPAAGFSNPSSPEVLYSINASGPRLSYSPSRYQSVTGPLAPAILEVVDNKVNDDEECDNNDYDGRDKGSRGSSRGRSRSTEEFKVYRRRWYILIVYSLLAATQAGLWNMYGPISASVEKVFGWTDATIALLTNWGPITYLLAGLFFSWMLDVKGIRLACVVTALLVAIGTGIKCISFDIPAVTWLTHVGQILNGLGGPVAMAAPPILSAAWFPPRERTTATAIGSIFNNLGIAASFIMGPLLMPDGSTNSTNTTLLSSSVGDSQYSLNISRNDSTDFLHFSHLLDADQIRKKKKSIAMYTYIGAGWSGFVLLLLLVYFPSKPLHPPCPSAAIQREDFLRGLKLVLTRGQFWLVTLIYGTSLGTLNSWSSVLDVILKPYGISENEAGWLGFYATCSVCVTALAISRFADFFKRIMKWLIFISYVIGTSAFLVFALTVVRIIPPSTVIFYVTIVTGITSLSAAVPLIFELSCELAYPAGEGTTNMILTLGNNFFGFIFLGLLMIPGIGSQWTLWFVVGTSGACLPLLFFMKERFNRLAIDEHNPSLNAEIVVPAPRH